jgi:hypothetical protein
MTENLEAAYRWESQNALPYDLKSLLKQIVP